MFVHAQCRRECAPDMLPRSNKGLAMNKRVILDKPTEPKYMNVLTAEPQRLPPTSSTQTMRREGRYLKRYDFQWRDTGWSAHYKLSISLSVAFVGNTSPMIDTCHCLLPMLSAISVAWLLRKNTLSLLQIQSIRKCNFYLNRFLFIIRIFH